MKTRGTLTVLLLLALMATGSGVEDNPEARRATAAPGGQSGAPLRGGTLRLVEQIDVDSLDPVRPGNRIHSLLVADALISVAEDGKPRPELAESWEWSPDHTTITFRLRRGVRFHNGREMTADDVAASLKRIRDDARVVTALRPLAQLVTDIRVLDPYAISAKFTQPLANAMDLFEQTFVVAPESAGDLASRIIATGPFRLLEYVPGSHLRLTRNPDYWKRGRPLLDEIFYRVIPDREALALSLEGGAADLVATLPTQASRRLARDSRFRVGMAAPGSQVAIVNMNVTQKPFDDRRVRQAVSHALDRRRIVDTVMGSGVEVYCLPYPKHSFAYDPEQARLCRYDPLQAKELLARAAPAEGLDVTILTTRAYDVEFRIAEILQANLSTVGIRAKVETLEQAATIANIRAGRFQIIAWGFLQATKDPSTIFLATMVWRPDRNLSRFASPDYERLVAESATTIDVAKRKGVFRRLNRLILTENFIIPIGHNPQWFAHRVQVQGMQWNREARLNLTEAWIGR